MKLFLSSGGIRPETKDEFIQLLTKDPKEVKVAFIPTACDPEEDKIYVKWTTDQIEELGMSWFEVELKGENADSLYEKLSKADVICVNGGNTFYLLDWVRKSSFDKIINKLLDEGKIYFGVSAGTYIACPTIEVSTWKHPKDYNLFGLDNLIALNLVDFLINVHFKPEKKIIVESDALDSKKPVVVLTDQQAIVVDEEKTILAGPKEVLTYNGFEFKE